MKIIKKINTSAALALNSIGQEIVVIGKGIGFPPMPYDLTDLSKIERTFYDVDPKYMSMIAELPKPILLASADIAEYAEIELECQLNPNLTFTLADHLNFAYQRLTKGINLTAPIAYDIRHLYSKEYEIGVQTLEKMREKTGIALPDYEAVSVAMHLINAETENSNLDNLLMLFQIISEIEKIIEKEFRFTLDKESYYYNRFVIHIRYLVQRLRDGKAGTNQNEKMCRIFAREYPDVYVCTNKVLRYLKENWGWACGSDECLYLMLHIERVRENIN